ncbi:MAG: Uma2 family endonuclease, partial [Acidobacteria bacterium]|nr:Uma2 family endonuclease [Acidobacteriota bacterium]
PDVMFIRASKLNTVSLDSRIEQAPDITVEVLSPSTASHDRGRKTRIFQRYQVPEYWIVDPVAETIIEWGSGIGDWGSVQSLRTEPQR